MNGMHIVMKDFTPSIVRDRALMLLKIERIQYCEQMELLDYKEEKAAPFKRGRGRLVRRQRISSRS
jgi:rRNA processing protein Krr1/Pno1